MHKKSNTYSSSAPLKSGPNMTGYYMGESSNLMAMMQKGGPTSRGAALLARAIQGTSDQDRLEEIQGEEAKRQGRGSLFGKGLGLLGGLAGAAIGGPAGAAIGTSLGKGFGEKLGAGRAKDYDTSGTVFGQQAFRDVDEASDEFNEGILGRAGMAGLQAGLTAGLTPGGGIYGAYNPLTGSGRQGISSLVSGTGITGFSGDQGLFRFASPDFTEVATDKFGTEILPGMAVDEYGYVNPLRGAQDGGLIEYQYGGGVGSVDSVLKDAGILATPEQLALFQQFDPSQLNQLAQSMQQSLMQGTQETDRQMAESGFTESGAIEQAQAQQREMAQDQFEQAEESAQSGFVSDTLAQAADDVRSGVEFNTYVPYEAVTPVEGSELPTVYQGDNISFQGTRYRWDSNTGKYVVFTGPNRPSGASDINLKESINLIGRSDNNVNIYTFKYRDKKYGDGVYQGVMAQEVPWASYKMNDGYLAVDYNKVDVDFKRVG
jgi:hypothetical protein